jgi:hypothetical protein
MSLHDLGKVDPGQIADQLHIRDPIRPGLGEGDARFDEEPERYEKCNFGNGKYFVNVYEIMPLVKQI